MPYNEELAARVRRNVAGIEGVTERKMFGGIGFMINGNMFCGITKDDLMARVGPDRHEAALASSGARPMDFAGRPMTGMVFVSPDGYHTDEQLRGWLDHTLDYARSLPAKKK